MFIKEIMIYKYGKWKETNFKDISSFTHIQGKNEAGKSTLTSFLLSILFGFPSKKDDRFKPAPTATSEVGGAILLESPQYGEVRIERMYGAKKASITLEDGSIKDEEWLRTFLGGFDRGLYENIYFFDLEGLQNVHKIQPEDITRFLLSASTIGSEKLFQIENELTKRLDSLFKPQGKNPILNQQLTTLSELDRKVKEKKKGIDQYNSLLQEQKQLNDRECELQRELKAVQKEIHLEKAWQATEPLIAKEEQLMEKLKEYEDIHFPENGLERWKEWTHAIKPLQAQESSLEERIRRVQAKLQKSEPVLLKEKNQIEFLLNQSTLLNRDLEVKSELQSKLKQTEELISEYQQKLGISNLESFQWNQSAIKEAEILLEKFTTAKKHIDEKINKEKLEQQRRNHSQEKLEHIKKDILSPQQLELEDGMIVEWETRLSIEKETSSIEDEITLLEKEKQKTKKSVEKSGKTENLLIGFVALLFLTAMSVSFIQSQWLYVLLSGLLFVVIGFSYRFVRRNRSVHDHISVRLHYLYEQLQQLNERVKDLSCTQSRYLAAKEKLQRHNRALEELRSVESAIKEQSWYVEELQKERMRDQQEVDSIRKSLENLYQLSTGKELKVDKLSFELPTIQGLQQVLVEKEKIRAQVNDLMKRTNKIQAELDVWSERLGLIGSLNEKILLLKQHLESEIELEQESKHQQEVFDELKLQLQKNNTEKSLIKEELEKLLKQARVEDEDSFLRKGYQMIERDRLLKQLEAVQEQLNLSPFSVSQRIERKENQSDLSLKLETLEKREREIFDSLEQTRKEVVTLDYQIKQIEEGGTYSDLIHQFYQEKHNFAEVAKEWSIYSMAKGWLQKAMVQFKEGTFPKVLQHAESVFKTLTDGNYERLLFSTENQELTVLHHKGKWYPVSTLSQATKEQVYVSIRFGLIEALYPTISLPIILDDSFVNFDPHRLSKVIESLKRLSERHQVIYFSCHPDMATYFTDDQVVYLEMYHSESQQQQKTV